VVKVVEITKSCLSCNGSGHRTILQHTPFGMMSQTIPCNNCKATGRVMQDPCKSCSGEGVQNFEETISIDIPKGVYNGITLTMVGYGNHILSGQPGELLIMINEEKHNKFRREGNDLHCEEWISIPDTVLGTNLKIQLINDILNLDITPGTESGKVITFSGKGTPILGNDGRNYGYGNLYIKVNVKIPKDIKPSEREIYQKLKDLTSKN
jgi:molecular chaperone DnaJ